MSQITMDALKALDAETALNVAWDDLPELGATSFNKGEFGADSPQGKVKASPHQYPPPASLFTTLA